MVSWGWQHYKRNFKIKSSTFQEEFVWMSMWSSFCLLRRRSILKSKYSEKEFSEPPTGVEPMTFQIRVGCSNHWAMGDSWWARSSTRFLYVCHVTLLTTRLGYRGVGGSDIFFLSISTWECFFIIYTLSKPQIYLSFIHICHFDMLSLAVWQDTCHTYKNLRVV